MLSAEYFSYYYNDMVAALLIPLLSVLPLSMLLSWCAKIDERERPLIKKIVEYLTISSIATPAFAFMLIILSLMDSFYFKWKILPMQIFFNLVVISYLSLAVSLLLLIFVYSWVNIKRCLIDNNQGKQLIQLQRQKYLQIIGDYRQQKFGIKGMIIVGSMLMVFYIPSFVWFSADCSSKIKLNCEVENLKVKLVKCMYIGYNPTNYNPNQQPKQYPSKDSIIEDLERLRDFGFDGIITFGAHGKLSSIPEIAKKEVGFKSVIMGVWNIKDEDEIKNAVSARKYVDAYCIELNSLNRDYTLEELKVVMKYIRKKTGKPVSTSQSVSNYYNNPELYHMSDWLSPDIHGYWYVPIDDWESTQVVSKKVGDEILRSIKQLTEQLLYEKVGDKPILVKFIGFPGIPPEEVKKIKDKEEKKRLERFTLEIQEAFFNHIICNVQRNTIFSNSNISFSYFDAFDTPWKKDEYKNYPEEAWTGIFYYKSPDDNSASEYKNRDPKPAAKILKKYLAKKK